MNKAENNVIRVPVALAAWHLSSSKDMRRCLQLPRRPTFEMLPPRPTSRIRTRKHGALAAAGGHLIW